MTRIEFPWTDEADATLIRMRAERIPLAKIAAEIGCSERAAETRSYFLRQDGHDVWVGNGASKKTPELVAKLRELVQQGKSTRDAGAQVGISVFTARKWLREADSDPAPAPTVTNMKPNPPPLTRTGRDPIPSGHPLSWGAITAGTVLDGVEYPR